MKRETVIVFTKYLLDFMFFAGIIVTLTLPLPGVVQKIMDFFDFHDFEGRYTEIIGDYRLELARKMGVDAAVDVKSEDLPAVMHKQGLVEGFDIGLEMSGSGAGLQQMISVMRNGGKISLLGISNQPVPMDMNKIICKGLTLQGIYGRKMDNWHQMSYMIQGGLDLTPVITHRFHLGLP